MIDPMRQIIFLLAGMGLSRKELRHLLQQVQRASIDDLVERVSTVGEKSIAVAETRSNEFSSDLSGRQHRNSTVGERVERLLKHEAKLSTGAASEILTKMLVDSGVLKIEDVPPLSKKALRYWVERLLQFVPAKEVLRVATIARNQIVHSPLADWTLGNKQK